MAEEKVRGSLTMEYAWNKGKGGGLFLENLCEKRFVGSRCESCGATSVPPRIFCGRCLGKTVFPVALADRGRVESFTVLRITGKAFVLVRLDGADNLFLHWFEAKTGPERGMRVKAVWAASRRGEITDLEGFEPDGG